jgi:hypothetical protein
MLSTMCRMWQWSFVEFDPRVKARVARLDAPSSDASASGRSAGGMRALHALS